MEQELAYVIFKVLTKPVKINPTKMQLFLNWLFFDHLDLS